MQAALQAKDERDRACAAAKRHNELVKQAEKIMKKKGGSIHSALLLFEAAFKEKHTPSTLLRVAELQYELNRFAEAADTADRVIRSQPSSAAHLAAAQAIVRKSGGVALRRQLTLTAQPIDGHLDAVLHGSTSIAPAPMDPWAAAAPPPGRVATDPWASDVPAATSRPPPPPAATPVPPVATQRRDADAISKADALFWRAAAPSPVAAGGGNPFAAEEATRGPARSDALGTALGAAGSGSEESPSEAETEAVSSAVEEEGERSSALVRVLSSEELLGEALEALSRVAARVDDLAAAGPDAEAELRKFTRKLTKLLR